MTARTRVKTLNLTAIFGKTLPTVSTKTPQDMATVHAYIDGRTTQDTVFGKSTTLVGQFRTDKVESANAVLPLPVTTALNDAFTEIAGDASTAPLGKTMVAIFALTLDAAGTWGARFVQEPIAASPLDMLHAYVEVLSTAPAVPE